MKHSDYQRCQPPGNQVSRYPVTQTSQQTNSNVDLGNSPRQDQISNESHVLCDPGRRSIMPPNDTSESINVNYNVASSSDQFVNNQLNYQATISANSEPSRNRSKDEADSSKRASYKMTSEFIA